MLYTSAQLSNHETKLIAVQRYFQKFNHHPKEFKRLRLHEKECFFYYLKSLIIVTDEGHKEDVSHLDSYSAWKQLEAKGLAVKAYNLHEIELAQEFVFFGIVLSYYHNLFFLHPVQGPYGILNDDEVQVDKGFFDMYFPKWEEQLFSNRGAYIPHILKEYRLKIKTLEKGRKLGAFGYNHFIAKQKELKLTCYHIYYRARLFFEELGHIYHRFVIEDTVFVADIYSFVHVFSRHYMPDSNDFDLTVSFNENLTFIDIYRLPLSVETIFRKYFKYYDVRYAREYILIRYDKSYYIFWIRFGYMDCVKQQCFHFRSFYKVEAKRDYAKLDGLKELQVEDRLFFYI